MISSWSRLLLLLWWPLGILLDLGGSSFSSEYMWFGARVAACSTTSSSTPRLLASRRSAWIQSWIPSSSSTRASSSSLSPFLLHRAPSRRATTPVLPSAAERRRIAMRSSPEASPTTHDQHVEKVLASEPSETSRPSSSTLQVRTNQELAQERLALAQAKREARRQGRLVIQQKNWKLRQLLLQQSPSSSAPSSSAAPPSNFSLESHLPSPPDASSSSLLLVAVKVSVCDELRRELKLSGREKRGRVFVESNSPATQSLLALRQEIQAFFRALRKGSYMLWAGGLATEPHHPPLDATNRTHVETASSKQEELGTPPLPGYWPVQTDEDVIKTFQAAQAYFEQHVETLPRPTLSLYVQRDPRAPPPPAPPAYLLNMPDPATSPTMTMLSFYAFPPQGIAQPEDFATLLRKTWKPFQALGRVYVATEGVNAQMSVPTNVLDRFMESCRLIPELGRYMENGINIDPVPLTRAEFATAGAPAAGVAGGEETTAGPPFTNLHIRVRRQVVADGLDQALDWQQAGYDMPPLQWHAQLKALRQQQQQQQQQQASTTSFSNVTTQETLTTQDNRNSGDRWPILLDCRNNYESDVGRFEGAEPLDTDNFRDSWEVLQRRLDGLPKDYPIMTYCTGGIRCVKVGAYLTQEMGFTNVSRLAGGIIAYDRTLKEKAAEEESMFKGTNFVFDGRLGRPITEDAIGTCLTCGASTSLVSNCRNENCHKRMIQCESCRTAFFGTCSDACRHRLVNGAMSPRRTMGGSNNNMSQGSNMNAAEDTDPPTASRTFHRTLDSYSQGYSSPVPSIFPELELNTRVLIPSGSHMVSGGAQGRLLKQLAAMTREGRILELGTFTGYATACLLEGAEAVARSTGFEGRGSRQVGPFVMTMERDAKAFDVAVAHMRVVTQNGFGSDAAEALCVLRDAKGSGGDAAASVPVVHEDVVTLESLSGGAAMCELRRVSDALAVVEAMAEGRYEQHGTQAIAPFDLVFVDADKTRLIEYAEACLASDRVLKKGGLMVVDNVLWKGLVLDAAAANQRERSDDSGDHDDDSSDDTGKSGYSFGAVDDQEEMDQLRKNRRARRLANKMHRFNQAIALDSRAEVLVLPLRDGLSIIRKL